MLSKHPMGVPIVAGVMGRCMGLGGVIPLVGSRGNTLVLTHCSKYLKVLKALKYIANSGLISTRRVTQSKQLTTSKDTMKGYQSDEKFGYLKKCLTYPNKNSKIFLHLSFFKNEEINFVLLQK